MLRIAPNAPKGSVTYRETPYAKSRAAKPVERTTEIPSRDGALTVDEFAEALISEGVQFVLEGYYSNSYGQIGYRAIYRDADRYLWFSVSSTEVSLAADEVATAIRARGRWVQRENPYLNRKGQQGFEATVLSGGHAFMLNASPDPPRWG
jgi:hypothetical protein